MKKLLLKFFETKEFPDWKVIAEKLIETGECIVAGKDCIWIGGIGNFISTKPADNAVGCSLYTFNLEYFKTSEYYKEFKANYLSDLYFKEDGLKIDLLRTQNEIKEIK